MSFAIRFVFFSTGFGSVVTSPNIYMPSSMLITTDFMLQFILKVFVDSNETLISILVTTQSSVIDVS